MVVDRDDIILVAGEKRTVNPTDLSVASNQFLAKYGLETQPQPSLGAAMVRPTRSADKPPASTPPTATPTPPTATATAAPQFERLLDITAIRQQSKLL